MLLPPIMEVSLPQTAIKGAFLFLILLAKEGGGRVGGQPALGSMPTSPPEEYKVSEADLLWAALINHPIRAH